jgi:hypothetical protein
MPWYRAGLLLAALALAGCSREAAPESVADDTARIPETTDAALAEWLNLPRHELAKKCEDWKGTVEKQLDTARTDRPSVLLLPKLLPAFAVPVLQDAQFTQRAGFSLPPYAAEGGADAGLALHLARHGDAEAARKVAPAGDDGLLHKIDEVRPERNYPVEWTRLVGLVQLSAQIRLANGEIEGAADLIQLHKQLRSLLDAKAASGPLGAALLPAGRRALAQAAAAWNEGGKPSLARDAEAAVQAWGESPSPAPLAPLGSGRAEAARVFPGPAEGHAVAAVGKAAARAADLLALPVPAEDLEGVVGLLDGKDRLAEYLVLYRVRASATFPEPVNLAQGLVDRGFQALPPAQANGVLRQNYSGGGLTYDVGVVSRGSPVGGFVRVADAQGTRAPAALPRDARDFGAVHLDRSFEQNRLGVAPNQKSAETVEVTRAADAAKVVLPGLDADGRKAVPAPAALVLKRQGDYPLLASLTLRWAPEHNTLALTKFLAPLWVAYGGSRIDGDSDAEGTRLVFVWEDERTRYSLRMPHNEEQAPEFVAEDRTSPEGADKRAAESLAFDREQRKARLAGSRPLVRLPRSLEAEPGVSLGMTRAAALEVARKSQSIRQKEVPGGVSRYFLTPAATSDASFPVQSFLRFGPDGKVAEVRVRYQDRPRDRADKAPTLLAKLSAAAGGAPDTVPAEWAGLWTDLPAQRPAPVQYRWLDDRTVLTLRRDAGGAEVALRDCPPDEPLGAKLPPLEFCPRGPEGVALGDARADLLKRWQVSEPTRTSDGGLVLPAPRKSPYDATVVYFDKEDKVARVLARHRAETALQPGQVPTALRDAWSRDFDRLGAVRRQDGATSLALPAYAWHDDRTRVRTFGLDSEQGPRLYTEWRQWPVPAVKPAGDQAAANQQ